MRQHTSTMPHFRGRGRIARERQFRVLLGLGILFMLPIALICQLLPSALRPQAFPGARSVYAEAREAAYTVVPYAFMG